MEEILDVAIIEDALQPKLRAVLKTQRISALNVVAIIRSVRTGVLGVKKGEQVSLRIQHRGDALDHRFHQRLSEIVGNVPAEDRVELHVAKNEIFFEEAIDVDSTRLRVAAVLRILGKQKNVFVVDAMSELCEMR